MKTDTIHRYKQLADALNLSVLELEQSIGVTVSRLNAAIRRNSKVNGDIVYKILDKYPNVNKSWLLNGEGEMFTNNQETKAHEPENPYQKTDVTAKYIALLEDYAEREKINSDRIYKLAEQLAANSERMAEQLTHLQENQKIIADAVFDVGKEVLAAKSDAQGKKHVHKQNG